jgi:hypothetical protein
MARGDTMVILGDEKKIWRAQKVQFKGELPFGANENLLEL